MAWSKCPSCHKSNFEMVEATPKNSAFKVMFVQCALCGAVVGVMDYINSCSLIEILGKEVEKQGKMLEDIKHQLNEINSKAR